MQVSQRVQELQLRGPRGLDLQALGQELRQILVVATLAVEKEEGDDADQRRQRDGQNDQRTEQAAAGKLVAAEEESQRDSDEGRQRYRGGGDPEALPKGTPFVWS